MLDITAACVQSWIEAGRTPAQVLRGVASALWGRAAADAGAGMAAIGLAMHFTVALTATLVFHALSRRIAFLRTAPLWLVGPLYGAIVFCAMNYGTLPACGAGDNHGMLELGLDTFGDVTRDPDQRPRSQAQVLRDVLDEAVLADSVGVDSFGVGEHHRADFAISAPEVVLAAIATRTKRMILGSAVTVLSTDDPVRVFQRFSTLNALSNGRAEVILGRGSFTESYALFGYDMSHYNELFEDKLRRFAELLKSASVFPPVEGGTLRTWVGVGGSPESAVRAARYGLPMTLAIIGGSPQRFLPFAELYRQTLAQHGQPPQPLGVHSPGHVAPTDAEAREEVWPHYEALMTRIGAERGWPPTSRAHFDREAGPEGALCVGSPETVAAKIANTVRLLGLSRFNLKYSSGTLPHEKLMRSIELFGTRVAPRVRELVASPRAAV